MECPRQIFRCLKAPLRRDKGKIIEIGPPTDFRKEELPAYFSDAETVTSQDSRTPIAEKDSMMIKMVALPSLTKGKVRAHARRMSVRLSSASETA